MPTPPWVQCSAPPSIRLEEGRTGSLGGGVGMHVCARVCISVCMLCSRQQESGCAQECVGVLGKECFFISEAH